MSKSILIVDDSESIREILKSLLEKEDYTITTANNGIEALKITTNNQFELIITDLHMPEMDGIEFIEKVRELENYKFTPILILTTETQQEEKNKAKKAGATGWIIKPFVPAKISSIVKRVLH